MDLIFLRHALPKWCRRRLLNRWNALQAREQIFNETRFYRNFIDPGDFVFDVGANVGLKTSVFLALGARVLAVEPNPPCANLIRKDQADALNTGKLTVEQTAVGANEGKLTLHVSNSDSTISSASEIFVGATENSETRFTSVVEVTVVPLDNLILRYGRPAFIKIDIEGMDHDALRGLSYRPKGLSFEFNTNPLLWNKIYACLDEVDRMGFTQANFSGSGTPQLRLASWVDLSSVAQLIQKWATGRETFGDVFVR